MITQRGEEGAKVREGQQAGWGIESSEQGTARRKLVQNRSLEKDRWSGVWLLSGRTGRGGRKLQGAVGGCVEFAAGDQECDHDGKGNQEGDQAEVARVVEHLLGAGWEA